MDITVSFPDLPPSFVHTNQSTFGEAGKRWLENLPAQLEDLAYRWQLRVDPPFLNLSFNYVAPVVRLTDRLPCVLKIGAPNPEREAERAALEWVDGNGAVRLLDADADSGALLLEMVAPGGDLAALYDAGQDDAATTAAAEVMRRFWRPAPTSGYPFPTVAEWAAELADLRPEFGGGTGPFPADLVAEAEALFRDLLASSEAPVLLHGDMHHYNILAAGPERGGWLAIDPKGVIGEPAYEAGALLRNPFSQIADDPANLPRVMARRLDILTEILEIDRERLRGWGVAQAVLSAWWAYVDDEPRGQGDGWRHALICARALSTVKG